MSDDEDPTAETLVRDLGVAADRLAGYLERRDGVRRGRADLIAMAIDNSVSQRNKQSEASTVPSLTARRLARGLQAVVPVPKLETFNLSGVTIDRALLEAIAQAAYDDTSKEALHRVLLNAIERGMQQLRVEAGLAGRKG